MKVKITELGVNLHYPLGPNGPYHIMRQYIVEAEDGRIDKIEEWDEPEMPSGEYDFSEETVNSIFNKPIELSEDEW